MSELPKSGPLHLHMHGLPTCLKEVVSSLQRKCGLKIPKTSSEEAWVLMPRTDVEIRRAMVLFDGLREARKPRFDVTKLLKVKPVY